MSTNLPEFYSRVKQETDLGCGIACIASVLGTCFWDALHIAENITHKPHAKQGICMRDIVRVLATKGLVYRTCHTPKRHFRFPAGSIVLVRYPSGRAKKKQTVSNQNSFYRNAHYLLKCRRGWMDPWGDFRTGKTKRAVYRCTLRPTWTVLRALLPAEAPGKRASHACRR